MEDIRVVILAGGKGTRLKPYTVAFPKPLVPLGDMPILEIILRQLKRYGFRKITLAVNHLADLLMAFFGDGSKFGLDISYCMEKKPLGTAGAITLVDNLTDPFLVMNGDLLTTIDYSKMIMEHRASGATATIGVFSRDVNVDFGVIDVNDNGSLADYREKPSFRFDVSMGVNIFSKSVLSLLPKDQKVDIPDLMMKIIHSGDTVQTYRPDCQWLDIGRQDDYELAVSLFDANRAVYLPENDL